MRFSLLYGIECSFLVVLKPKALAIYHTGIYSPSWLDVGAVAARCGGCVWTKFAPNIGRRRLERRNTFLALPRFSVQRRPEELPFSLIQTADLARLPPPTV
jgi:hypothetical protein